MKFAADLHLHSQYSQATSPRMNLANLSQWARVKGIKLMGTGDFTHPQWFAQIQEKLIPAPRGLFTVKDSKSGTLFLLTAEVSCIYTQDGRVRKVHIVIFAPSFNAVKKINSQLSAIADLSLDGRPTLMIGAPELVKIVLDASPDCLIIPAHAMTPWFGVFGSRSGFDSLEECFGDYAKYIYAIETGLSADPPMLWRIPDGRRVALISNSDAHSPEKIGREVNVFDIEPDYFALKDALIAKDPKRFLYTIEFFPEEGKYHFDGHRSCGISLSPEESKKHDNLCPKCRRPLTIGVLNRIQELSASSPLYSASNPPPGAIPYKSLVPLYEIIADVLKTNVIAKQVKLEYQNLIQAFGSEFAVLLGPSAAELQKVVSPEITQGIINVRDGKVDLTPGYDGIFGHVHCS